MEPRARRHQLREQLDRARAALDGGDRDAALAAVARALELDPDYLAAQALREHITRLPASAQVAGTAAAPSPARKPRPSSDDATERWSRFEQRARARRIEKRAASARHAMASLRLVAARAAIDEIRALDPTHPDLLALRCEFDAATLRADTSPGRVGPILIATAVFVAGVLGAGP